MAVWQLTDDEIDDILNITDLTVKQQQLVDDTNGSYEWEDEDCDLLNIARSGNVRAFEAMLVQYRAVLNRNAGTGHGMRVQVSITDDTALQVLADTLVAQMSNYDTVGNKILTEELLKVYPPEVADSFKHNLRYLNKAQLQGLVEMLPIPVAINASTSFSAVMRQIRQHMKATEVTATKKIASRNELIKQYKDMGKTQQWVSNELGVSIATVKRYWNK